MTNEIEGTLQEILKLATSGNIPNAAKVKLIWESPSESTTNNQNIKGIQTIEFLKELSENTLVDISQIEEADKELDDFFDILSQNRVLSGERPLFQNKNSK